MEDDTIDKFIPLPLDGGYGWVIAGCAFVIGVLYEGSVATYGVFLQEISEYFGSDQATTSLAGSATIFGAYCINGFIMGPILERFTARRVTIIGAILSTASILVSTLSPNIYVFVLLYGLTAGTSLGSASYGVIIALGFYFAKKRPLAMASCYAGGSLGAVMMAPFFGYLLDQMDWKNAFVIAAGLIFNITVCGSLLRPLADNYYMPTDSELLETHENNLLSQERRPSAASSMQYSHHQMASRHRSLASSYNHMLSVMASVDEMSHETASSHETHQIHERHQENTDIRELHMPMNGENRHKAMSSQSLMKLTLWKPHQSLSHYASKQSIRSRERARFYKTRGFSRQELRQVKEQLQVYQNPMNKMDIFYSGSILKLPEYTSHADLTDYIKSTTRMDKLGQPIDEHPVEDSIDYHAQINKPAFSDNRTIRKCIAYLRLWTQIRFLIMPLVSFCHFIANFTCYIYAEQLLQYATGDPTARGEIIIMIMGIAGFLGRFLAAVVSTFTNFSLLQLQAVMFAVAAAVGICTPMASGFFSVAVIASTMALLLAGLHPLVPCILVDLLGLEKLGTSYAAVNMFRGIAGLAGPPIAGYLIDRTQYKCAPYLLCAGASAVACIGTCLLLLYMKATTKSKNRRGAESRDQTTACEQLNKREESHEKSPID